jgi:hypothetical protein
MALGGISQYLSNTYSRSGSSTSSQLASLLNRSSVNSKMLKRSYSGQSEKAEKTSLNRTDISETSASKNYHSGSLSETENAAALKESSSKMVLAAASLTNSDKMTDDELAAKVGDFAESFNKAASALKNTSSRTSKLIGESIAGITGSFKTALSKAGITVNDDSTLSVDENVLKENRGQAESLFKSSYSFGAKMMKKGSELQNAAQLTGFSAAGIYNRFGCFTDSSSE